MQFRTMACLVLLATLSAASTQALGPDSMKQCNVATSSCTGEEAMVWTQNVTEGDEVHVFIDYDIHEAGVDFCEAIWFATFNSDQLAFISSKSINNPSSESVLCETYPEAASWWCPECDTLLACIWYRNIFPKRPVVSISAEVEMKFMAVEAGDAVVYADEWYSYGHSFSLGQDCSVEISGGQITFPDVAIPVPEPGSGLMLMAGVPFLAWIGRKHGSKKVSDGQLEAVAQASRSLPPVADEEDRLARIKSNLDQAIG